MYDNPHNPLAWIRGMNKGHVNIGSNVWIGPFCVIDGEYDFVELGDNVNVSSGAQIVTHDTVKRCITGGLNNTIDHAPVKIERNVYIGTNAVILKGCIIGESSIIAAGAIVKENSIIPPFSLVVGIPGVIKKNIKEDYTNWINDDTI
jgi:carbonic anhydrase/acetyltransferase-like protein (isoleucine patch superfamily)